MTTTSAPPTGQPVEPSLPPVFNEIDTLIRARYPILYLLSHEEARIESLLLQIAKKQSKKLLIWSATEGLLQKSEQGTQAPAGDRGSAIHDPIELLRAILSAEGSIIYVLKDFHVFLEDPHVTRLLRDLAREFRSSHKTILIVSPRLNLPIELEKEVTLLDVPLPTTNELSALLSSVCQSLRSKSEGRVQLTDSDVSAMIKAARGLTLLEAENAFAKAVVVNSVLDKRDIDLVLKEKEQIIRKSGMLEFFPSDLKLQEVGGLAQLKEWLLIRGKGFSSQAHKFGLQAPKGVLLLGAPGCGKSMTAKAIAHTWKIPLLRLDFGRIFSGLVGSSEENMRRALKIAEGVAPAVLWIDEIEKGLAGSRTGSSDSGTAARVFGTFLTWMQESQSGVFVVATANSISQLPPELLRRGRFDEIFFTDLPKRSSRREILSIHLFKKGRDPKNFDLDLIASATEGFSGAELEHCVTEGLFLAFHEKRDVKTEDLLKTAKDTMPLATVYAEELRSLRSWAKTRARSADSPEPDPQKPAQSRISLCEEKGKKAG